MSQFITKGRKRNLVLKKYSECSSVLRPTLRVFACVSLLSSHTWSAKFENPTFSVFILFFKLKLQFDLQLLRSNDAS